MSEARCPEAGSWSQETLERACGGSRLVTHCLWMAETDSTQEELRRRLAHDNASERWLVVAGAQTAGRGRLGRSWFSPPGHGLWFSLLLAPRRIRIEWPFVTQVTAVSLRRAIQEAAGLEARIKWPNDLLSGGRKIAGILAETMSNSMAVGVGINLGQRREDFPPDIRETASSLVLETGRCPDPVRLLSAFLAAFQEDLERFETAGPSSFRNELNAASALHGRTIRMSDGRAGRALDVEPSGTLQIETERGDRISIASGEIIAIDPPLEKRASF